MLKNKITPQETSELKKYFNECRNVVIVSHTAPDGDAIGSSLGLYQYLTRKGKHVTVIVPNLFPDFLRWMKDSDKIVIYERQKTHANVVISQADLICCLDFNVPSRIDELQVPVMQVRCRKILVDHHIGPDKSLGDIVISHTDASSTCELIFRIITAIGGYDALPFAGAESLYAGLATDTGFFNYNSNNPDVFIILSELLRKGIDKDLINRRIQNNFSPDRVKFLGYVLYEKLKVYSDLHASYFSITRDELTQFNYVKGDMEGIVNMPLQIKGHKLSISLREDTEKDMILISTRSVDDFPCNEFCAQYYNGGGHKNASGGRLYCSMEEAIAITERALEEWSERLKAE